MPDSQEKADKPVLSRPILSRDDSAEKRAPALRENLKKRKSQAALREDVQGNENDDGRNDED